MYMHCDIHVTSVLGFKTFYNLEDSAICLPSWTMTPSTRKPAS